MTGTAVFPGQALREARGKRHDGERRIGASLCWHDAAVADEKVGDAPRAVVGVDDAVVGSAAHAAAAHEVGIAVDREHVLRPRREVQL